MRVKKPQTSISRDALIASMKRLANSEDFKLLRGRWLDLRGRILDHGKEKPSEAQWSVLKGFDTAVLEAEFWASQEARDSDLQKRADQLMAYLAGSNGEGK